MINRDDSTRPRRSLGRTLASLVALAAVVAGIPTLLVACSRLGLDAAHPFPAIGSRGEISDYFARGLTSTEVTSIALRGSLIVGWVIWAAMVSSVLGAIAEASRGHSVAIPQFRIFGGLSRWIVSGLAAATVVVPSLSSVGLAGGSAPPLPATATFVRAIAHPELHATAARSAPSIATPAASRAGFETVRAGESAQTFAERVLGDGARWRELFDRNRGRVVGPDGAMWTESWRILPGWELQLPPDAVVTEYAAPSGLLSGAAGPTAHTPTLAAITESATPTPAPAPAAEMVGERVVADGDDYWSIAEQQLGASASRSEVAQQAQALMSLNAPRLGYSDPAMMQPGDIVMLVAPSPSTEVVTAAAASASGVPYHVVVEGDTYWAIATQRAIALYGADGAYASRVFELSEDLQDLNWPRLGYEDRPMLQPGDIVYLEDPATYTTPAPPPAPASLPPPTGVVPTETPAPAVDTLEIVDAVVAGAAEGIDETDAEPAPAPAPAPTTTLAGVDGDGDDDDDAAAFSPVRAVLGLSALATAGTAGVFARRRRRAGRGRPHQRPAPLPAHLTAAVEALSYADPSDVMWLGLELRWLVHQCPPALRASLLIEEIQVADRDVEVAFSTTPLSEPPAGWSMATERIWQLDTPHTFEELAAYHDLPPLLPGLVTLGHYVGGELYCNLENHPGINVSGDPDVADEWVTNIVWEISGGAFAEHPTILLVDVDVPGVRSLDGIERLTNSDALAHFDNEPAPSPERGLLDRRTEQFDGWDTTLVVLGRGANTTGWTPIAARANVGVVSLAEPLPGGLDLYIEHGKVTVPRWNISVDVAGLGSDDADSVADLLGAVEAPPVPDDLEIPMITEDTTFLGATASTADEGGESEPAPESEWRAPSWLVTVRLLAGTPRAEDADGNDLRMKPQPMAALAYLALHREVRLDDLRDAIWGDQPVKSHRVRDLLSDLRKQVGRGIVSHIEDGVVRASDDLGSDIGLFEALAERARTVPGEAGDRLATMVDLVGGRPFKYAQSAALYWRWVDAAHLEALWSHRIATAAYELAELHLAHDDPTMAYAVAERGLQADALNAGLTEMVMTAFGRLGAPDRARQVFEQHERRLQELDLGGASDETRRVLDNLITVNASGIVDDDGPDSPESPAAFAG